MMIVMKADASEEEVKHVEERLAHFGLGAVTLHGKERIAIAAIGTNALEHADQMRTLPGVTEVVPISRPFKLASREVKPSDTVVRIGNVEIGAGRPLAVMAGPCSVETLEQTVTTARPSLRRRASSAAAPTSPRPAVQLPRPRRAWVDILAEACG